VQFYAESLNVSPDHVLVSGDSGNDLALYEHGFRGIVVANAHPELKDLDGPNVFHATRPMAAGVVEGLEHWLNGKSKGGGLNALRFGRFTPQD
jgi:hydroxymethylpyrimidine pyrophosphatase-like HAD family hydrolase